VKFKFNCLIIYFILERQLLLNVKTFYTICCVLELTRALSKLEERVAKRERIIEEKGTEIEKLQKIIQNLEMVSNYLL